MRKIFNDLESAPGRALQAGVHSRIWNLFLVFPCFAAAVAVSPAAAQNLSARAMRSRDLVEIVHTKTESISHPLENQQESVPQNPRLPASGLDETASNQPQVFYENGLLEILAENSALSDILAAVREKTGADIELPASAAGQRVYARIGPGPARKVLGALLSLTDLDFVIQAPEIDPQGIQRVLLTQRLKASAGMNGKIDASPSQPIRMLARRAPGFGTGRGEPVGAENSGSAAPDSTVPDQAVPTAQQPASSDPQAALSAAQAAAAATASDSDSGQPAKTSEQMMQDLQNLYQLRKQQMQQVQQNKKP